MAGMPPQGSTILKRQKNPPAAGRRNPRRSLLELRPRPPEERRANSRKHNDAAFVAYALAARLGRGDSQMRFILGIIIGCALTVGGAYVVDRISVAAAKPVMVNWDVVAKNFDSATSRAREGWKKIAG